MNRQPSVEKGSCQRSREPLKKDPASEAGSAGCRVMLTILAVDAEAFEVELGS
jgi:hypothetical protein